MTVVQKKNIFVCKHLAQGSSISALENGHHNFFSFEKNPEITPSGHLQWQPSIPSPPKEPPSYKPEGTKAACWTPSSIEEPPCSRPSYSGTRPLHCSFFWSSIADRVQSYPTLYIVDAYSKSLWPALKKHLADFRDQLPSLELDWWPRLVIEIGSLNQP